MTRMTSTIMYHTSLRCELDRAQATCQRASMGEPLVPTVLPLSTLSPFVDPSDGRNTPNIVYEPILITSPDNSLMLLNRRRDPECPEGRTGLVDHSWPAIQRLFKAGRCSSGVIQPSPVR